MTNIILSLVSAICLSYILGSLMLTDPLKAVILTAGLGCLFILENDKKS